MVAQPPVKGLDGESLPLPPCFFPCSLPYLTSTPILSFLLLKVENLPNFCSVLKSVIIQNTKQQSPLFLHAPPFIWNTLRPLWLANLCSSFRSKLQLHWPRDYVCLCCHSTFFLRGTYHNFLGSYSFNSCLSLQVDCKLHKVRDHLWCFYTTGYLSPSLWYLAHNKCSIHFYLLDELSN